MSAYYGPQDGFRPAATGPSPALPPTPALPAMPPTAAPVPMLGLVSLIISSVALLLVVGLVLAVLVTFLGAVADEDEDYYGGGGGTVTGQLDTRPTGVLSGTALVQELTATLVASGSEVDQLQCPDTPAVKQGVVTICHGTVDYEPWALAVFFESDSGTYTVDFI